MTNFSFQHSKNPKILRSNPSNLQVLYEDNHLIVVNKRPGDIVQGDKTGDVPLSEVVKEYLKIKYNKPGNVFLGVVHRLDRPTSGIVVFAKTSKALPRLNALFSQGKTKKTYSIFSRFQIESLFERKKVQDFAVQKKFTFFNIIGNF